MKHLITLTALLLLSSLTSLSAQTIASTDHISFDVDTASPFHEEVDTSNVWLAIAYCKTCVIVQRKGYQVSHKMVHNTQKFFVGSDKPTVYLDSKRNPIPSKWTLWQVIARNEE